MPLRLVAPLLLAATTLAATATTAAAAEVDGPFRKRVLVDMKTPQPGGLKDPMELAVTPDGRVIYAERGGAVKIWKPATGAVVLAGMLPVFTDLEDGLLGLTLDPQFARNGWVYLNRSLPETRSTREGRRGFLRTSRFTLRGDTLDLSSERAIIEIETQRDECCHVGGSLAFDPQGNLYIAVGDNTNPFGSDGFSPTDRRPGRAAWSAEKSSANMNDLRGGVIRVKPKPEGGYDIPPGNLFPPGTPGTRPEIYVKGCRNVFRISVDPKSGFLYWGDVGPDAGQFKEGRGPAGQDEINQARAAGFFGWPYFVGNNGAYWHWDFEKNVSGERFDPRAVKNLSPFNTGVQELPPAQPAFLHYAHSPSPRWPALNGDGGRTAMAGPVYHFDPALASAMKLPAEYDRTLFLYEWSRNWIVAVKLDADDRIASVKRFCARMTFRRPMDLELGPDGCLYLIEWGTHWSDNKDTQIVRIEHAGGPATAGQ